MYSVSEQDKKKGHLTLRVLLSVGTFGSRTSQIILVIFARHPTEQSLCIILVAWVHRCNFIPERRQIRHMCMITAKIHIWLVCKWQGCIHWGFYGKHQRQIPLHCLQKRLLTNVSQGTAGIWTQDLLFTRQALSPSKPQRRKPGASLPSSSVFLGTQSKEEDSCG